MRTQQTVAFKQQMQIGARIADQLPKKAELGEVARALKLSDTMVRRIECQALFKVQQRLKSFFHEYTN